MSNRSNRVSGKRLKGVGVYLTRAVYDAWLDKLTAKELAMAMFPPSEQELADILAGDRRNYQILSIQMPGWWVEWYKQLSKEDKFRFASLIEKRLTSIGLVGGGV